MKVEQNIARLRYLLALYKMSEEELLSLISEGLKKPIRKEEIFSNEIKVNHLKRIDEIFNKGLHFYLDPKSPEVSKDASIFFRKEKFGVDLNIGAKKIVNQFEDFKISLSAIASLADLNFERTLPVYNLQHSPQTVANQLRNSLYPEFSTEQKDFLKAIIGNLAKKNILVLEFVETWNKTDKANIDGFFLNPNVIVLKRQQSAFRREIFTLIHELGHYLLNEEEVDLLEIQTLSSPKLSAIERWCNDFAYYFLIGHYDKIIESITTANSTNDYYLATIEKISKSTHLSPIALFTRLLFSNKITQRNYNKIKLDYDERFRLKQEEEKRLRELQKEQGGKPGGAAPKPINSPLLISTIQTAFFEGVISEYDVCKTLNIKPDKLETYLQ